jgi:hypothetical protein
MALGRESQYYAELQQWNHDVYTKSKTSLVKPTQGFPAHTNLAFDAVTFSCLDSVTYTVDNADATFERPTEVPSTQEPHKSVMEAHQSNHKPDQPLGWQDSSSSTHKDAIVHKADMPSQPHQEDSPEVLKLASTATPWSSSHNSAEQNWETRFENMYSPPAQDAWAEPNPTTWRDETPRTNGNDRPRHQPREKWSTIGGPPETFRPTRAVNGGQSRTRPIHEPSMSGGGARGPLALSQESLTVVGMK